jgi:hypothetical protein
MAVEGEKVSAKQAPQKPTTAAGAPVWTVPAYVAGLVLLYVAERVIVTEDSLKTVLSAVGVALVAFTTALHFVPKFRSEGQRASVERLLGLLSVVGVVGLLLYFASTAWGLDALGVSSLDKETGEQIEALLLIAWVTLIAASVVPLLFAELALHPMRTSEHLEARRVKAAAAGGFALSLAVAYCSLFVYAAGESDVQADYSYFKTSEPGSSTRKMVEGFDETVKITAFFPDVSEVRKEVAGYLTELVDGVPNVELQIVDRYLEPKLAQELKVFSDGTIVFAKGDTKGTLTVGSDMQAARAKLKTLDRDVQEQLYKLLRSRRVAYLTAGHGELNAPSPGEKAKGRSSQILEEILRKQNYQVRTLGLAQGLGSEVPDDAAIVFVLGPTEPLAPEEVASLARYSEQGGKLFMALDADSLAADTPEQLGATETAAATEGKPVEEGAAAPADALTPAQAGLQELAKVAGLSFAPELLANESHHVRGRSNVSDRALLISNRFSSHASVSTLSRNATRAAIFFARAGSLSSLGTAGMKVDMALRAMGGTFADRNGDYEFDKESEKKDTYNLAAAVTAPVKAVAKAKPAGDGKDKAEAEEMRAFVLSDADSMSDLLMSNFGPNRLLLMDAIRWLGGEDSYAGEINNEEDVRIEHSKQKDLVWFYGTIFGVPLIVLGAGLSFGRRARRTFKAVS